LNNPPNPTFDKGVMNVAASGFAPAVKGWWGGLKEVDHVVEKMYQNSAHPPLAIVFGKKRRVK
jgi:hypothetical protein